MQKPTTPPGKVGLSRLGDDAGIVEGDAFDTGEDQEGNVSESGLPGRDEFVEGVGDRLWAGRENLLELRPN